MKSGKISGQYFAMTGQNSGMTDACFHGMIMETNVGSVLTRCLRILQ